MRNRCYLVDENTTPALANQLRRLQPNLTVLTIGDGIAPPKGTCDPDILFWLEKHDYSLVTRNRKSMPDHLQEHLAQGHHIPGIFTLRPKASLGEVLDDLLLIWEVAEPDEYQDQIVHIPASGDMIGLADSITASNFGKSSDEATDADLALAIFNLVYQTIGMVAHGAAKATKNTHVILTGKLATFPQAANIFADLSSLFGLESQIPKWAEYATAVGAAVLAHCL